MPPLETTHNPYAALLAVSVSYHEILMKWLVTIRGKPLSSYDQYHESNQEYLVLTCPRISTEKARTATSSGNCNLVQSERTYTGQQCSFGDGDTLDKESGDSSSDVQ